MKNAILLHGTGDSPNSFWLPYIKKELEKRDYTIWAPQLPDHTNPNLEIQLPYLLQHGIFTSQTIIIAHSAGCPLTLAVLEKISTKVKQVILVAGFCEPSGKLESFKSILREHYDWKSIQNNVEEFIAINSDNDPWGCDDTQGRVMCENIGGTLIIRYGEGHMGSNVFNQPYTEFPFLVRLIA